jgi:hypothetical protein
MRQRINIAVSIEMDAEDLALLDDDLGDHLVIAAGNGALAMIPRAVGAVIAASRFNVSPPYSPEDAS